MLIHLSYMSSSLIVNCWCVVCNSGGVVCCVDGRYCCIVGVLATMVLSSTPDHSVSTTGLQSDIIIDWSL